MHTRQPAQREIDIKRLKRPRVPPHGCTWGPDGCPTCHPERYVERFARDALKHVKVLCPIFRA